MPCLQLISSSRPMLELGLRGLVATTFAAAAISMVGCRAEATAEPAPSTSQARAAAFTSDNSYFPHQFQNQATEVEPLPAQF